MRRLHPLRLLVLLSIPTLSLLADRHVVVIARADPDYARSRYDAEGTLIPQSYVFMKGNHYPGGTVDRTMERMSFEEIAGQLAPELAKRQYFPSQSVTDADLLLIVHWGTTLPKTGIQEMTAPVTEDVDHQKAMLDTLRRFEPSTQLETGFSDLPAGTTLPESEEFNRQQQFNQLNRLTDELSRQVRRGDNASLLGYNEELHRLGQGAWSGERERSLIHDLNSERYFIIIRAYELKNRAVGPKTNRPVWTMHLNIRSPGNNFQTALERMSLIASQFAGSNTGTVETVKVRRNAPSVSVTLGELIILGETSVK